MTACEELKRLWRPKKFSTWLRKQPQKLDRELQQQCFQIVEDLKKSEPKKILRQKKIQDITSEIERMLHDHPIIGPEEEKKLEEWVEALNKLVNKKRNKSGR